MRLDDGEPFLRGARVRIFLISFSLLFFELLCIRWIPAYVRYLSYFTNFILLASFLGMGLGLLAARRARFRFPSFSVMVLLLTAVVAVNRFELNISSTDVLYFGSGTTGFARAESFILLPLIILTGLTLSPGMNAAWPWLLDLTGGRQSARSIHFICAMALAAFIVVPFAAGS